MTVPSKLVSILETHNVKWLRAKEAGHISCDSIEATEEALNRADTLWGKTRLSSQFRQRLAQRGTSLFDHTLEDHFTGSAIVLDPATRSILMTFHPWYNLWLQLGGHDINKPLCNPLATSAREAEEESGIADLWICDYPVRVDPHSARKCKAPKSGTNNHHYDICYLLVAKDTNFVMSDESTDMKWVTLPELRELVANNHAQQRALRMAQNALSLYDALAHLDKLP